MNEVFESDDINLMATALQKALGRLRALGLIDGDETAASAVLTKLIVEAVDRGERDEENLILFAMGRFHPNARAENT